MRTKLLFSFLAALFLFSAVAAQDSKPPKKVLKNADIIVMVQNHFDDATLIKLIAISDCDFDLSTDALLELHKAGVSGVVLRAMMQASLREPSESTSPSTAAARVSDSTPPDPASAPSASVAPATPAPTAAPPTPAAPPQASSTAPLPSMPVMSGMNGAAMNPSMMSMMASMGGMLSMSNYSPDQMPRVYLFGETPGSKMEIPPSMAQMAQSKFKGGGPSRSGMLLHSLAGQALQFAAMGAGPGGMMAMSAFSMGSGMMGGMRHGAPTMTYVWGLPARKSQRELHSPTPRFELTYGEIPGVDPDGYEPAVVRLVPTKDNYRLVGATKSKMGMGSMMGGGGPDQGQWFDEERWPTRLSKEERGFYVMNVDQPLEPGEYAVVLRPIKGYKPTVSGFGGGAQVFYSVWDFSVPGESHDHSKKSH